MLRYSIGLAALLIGASPGMSQTSDSPQQQILNPTQPSISLPPLVAHLDPPRSDDQHSTPAVFGGLEEQLAQGTRDLQNLRSQMAQANNPTEMQRMQKQVELLQKQVEILQNMLKLMSEQIKKQPAPTPPASTEKLQLDVATIEARTQEAARRDQELANAIDDINEHMDAVERNPQFPAQLKELFLPSGNNETPLSIYGALAFGYSHIQQQPGGFYFGEFTPDFLLKLNDWIFLEAELGIGGNGSVSAGSFAQADFFVNDWLTIIGGRFVAPIGFFNERLNNPWINKLPGDAPGSGPLLWQQVLPAMSLLGVQAQGSFYLGCTPFKMEYSAYISNGLNLTPATAGSPTLSEFANLQNMESTFSSITNQKAFGGRLGWWWPAMGLEAGISGMINGDYVAGGFEDSISLWALDFNYHKGNWDFRAEYGMTFQQAGPFLGANIQREGFYTQLAYRPRDAANKYLQNVELIYRYSYVDFPGIDANELDFTTFSTPIDVPIRRQQNEIGIDYWFYPRCVLKFAYQINDEPGFHLNDNQFISELAWGW